MKKMMYFGFQFNEPNENYEEDLSKEAEDIINTLNPWKIDEWVAILFNSSWYPGVITEVLFVHYFHVLLMLSIANISVTSSRLTSMLYILFS